MHLTNPTSKRTVVTLVLLISILVTACGGSPTSQPKPYTIGALVLSVQLVPVWEGFKAGLADQGFVEGKNVTYVYSAPTNTIDALKPEAERLKAQGLDLLVTCGTPPTQTAKEVFAGTNVPILFAPVLNPVELGLAASYRSPGGNLTGIQSTDTIAKALEWLTQVAPGIKRIYVPHNPKDDASVQSLQSLTSAAKTLSVELVVSPGSTPDELATITKTIPENVDAVFLLRSGTFGSVVSNLAQAAIARRLPSAASDIGPNLSSGMMVGYGPGYPEMGKQLARMAGSVLKGKAPGTVPIEPAEAYLGINLQTAQAVGIEIPDSILRQAMRIIRLPSDQTAAATAAK